MPGIARGTGVAVELRQYPYHFNRNGIYSWEIGQKDIHVIPLVNTGTWAVSWGYDIRVMVGMSCPGFGQGVLESDTCKGRASEGLT